MANNFEMIGKLIALKDKETKEVCNTKTYPSGWQNTQVDFLCVSGTNSVRCTVRGGKWSSDAKNIVKTMTAKRKMEDGSIAESEKIDIPWDKRFDKEEVDKVAGYRKFIFDNSNPDIRREMRFAKKALEDGDRNSKSLQRFSFTTIEEADEAIQKENEKKQSFIAEWDFAQAVGEYLTASTKADTLFKISGTYDISYNPENKKTYTSYKVTRIVKANKNEEQTCRFNNLRVYIPKDFIDDEDLADTGKAMIHGYLSYYDSSVRNNGFMPMNIALYGDKRKIDYFKKKTDGAESEICAFDMIVDIINSSTFREITMDDLTDDELMDIEFGVRTFEAIKAARSGRIAGDKVTEFRFVSLYNGELIQTNYSEDDMGPAQREEDNLDDDLFDDLFDD